MVTPLEPHRPRPPQHEATCHRRPASDRARGGGQRLEGTPAQTVPENGSLRAAEEAVDAISPRSTLAFCLRTTYSMRQVPATFVLALCMASSACNDGGSAEPADSGPPEAPVGLDATDAQLLDSASAPGPRIFSSSFSLLGCPDFSACDPGTCAGDQVCFHITDELHVCDAPSVPPPNCQPGPGLAFGEVECGCSVREAGTGVCAAGQVCRQTDHCVGSGNAGTTDLHCVDVCSSPADCPAGSACVPSSLIYDAGCVEVSCHTDLECDAAPGGVCGLVIAKGSQCGDWFAWGTRCAYPAFADGGSPCANPWSLTACPDLNQNDKYLGCLP